MVRFVRLTAELNPFSEACWSILMAARAIWIQAISASKSRTVGAALIVTPSIRPAGISRYSARRDSRSSVTPLQADQELHSSDIIYWEGAVRVSGDVSGYGYAELTGYAGSMQGRF